MSLKVTITIFSVVFVIGLITIVFLPFFLNRGPVSPEPVTEEETPQAAAQKERGVFRSDDGGVFWEQKAFQEGENASIAAFQVNRLIQDAIAADSLYLATDGNGLWVTESRGDL